MKKKVLMVLLAGVLVLGVTGCSSSSEETEKATEKTTTAATEKTTTAATEKATEKSTELEAPSDTLEGEITEVDEDTGDGEAIVLKTKDGKEYTIFTDEAELDLDSNGLEKGITVKVTLQSKEATDGSFTATKIVEEDDPNASSQPSTTKQTEKQTEKQTSAPQTESQTNPPQTESQTSAPQTEGTITVDGVVTETDGDTMTVDSGDGNTYDFLIADADMDLDDNGLFEGIAVTVTANTPPDSNGLYEAISVEETDDPVADETDNTMND